MTASSTSDTTGDGALVERLKAGDLGALDVLIDRHHPLVYRAALRVVREPELAEEVTQDVFVVLYQKAAEFRGESKLTTWLYRVATNRARNAATSRIVRQTRRTESLDAPLGDGDSGHTAGDLLSENGRSPREEATRREQMRALTAAVRELGDAHREVIELRFFEDLSYEEIAERLEIGLGTVKSRLSRARQDLSERLRAAGTGLFDEFLEAVSPRGAGAAVRQEAGHA